jgi:hypothetical protein
MNIFKQNYQAAAIQFTSQILTLISFLVLTPIYLKNWKPDEYRTWILLLIVFQVIEIFDLGQIVATINRVSEALGKSTKTAQDLIRDSAKALASTDFYLGALIGVLVTFVLTINSQTGLIPICVIFLINSITNHWFGFILNISRVIGDQRKTYLFSGFYVFFQSCMWALAAFLHQPILYSAVLGLIFCMIFLIFSFFKLLPYEVQKEIFPSFMQLPRVQSFFQSVKLANYSFFLNTLISLLSAHGYAVVASFFVQPSLFIAYIVLKTISRTLITSSIALGNSYWKSFAKIKANTSEVRALATNLIKITLITIFVEAVIIILFTKSFIEVWSRNTIIFEFSLMLLLTLYSVIGAMAYSLRYVFFGISEEKFVVTLSGVTLLSGLLLSIWLGSSMGVAGILYGQIAAETLLLLGLGIRLHKVTRFRAP